MNSILLQNKKVKDVLYEGILPKQQKGFSVEMLGQEHIEQCLGLQKVVLDSLKKDEKNYIVQRDYKDYQFMLNDGFLYGAFCDGELISQAVLEFPNVSLPNENGIKEGNIALNGAMLVHPDFRNNGLKPLLTAIREQKASQEGRDYLLTAISVKNYHSWKSSFDSGMKLISVMESLKDGHLVYIFLKHLTRSLSYQQTDDVIRGQVSDDVYKIQALEESVSLLKDKVGVGFDKKTNAIELAIPSQDINRQMQDKIRIYELLKRYQHII